MHLHYQVFTNSNQNLLNILPDKVTKFYLQHWSSVLNDLNSTSDKLFSELENSSRVYCLFNESDDVVALHLAKDHSNFDDDYFDFYPIEAINFLNERGFKKFQALTHFIVNPKYSGREFAKYQIPRIMAGLSFKNQLEYDLDFSVTIARKDIGVHSLSKKFGAIEICEAQKMHNVDVQIMGFFDLNFEVLKDNILFQGIWNNRTDEKGKPSMDITSLFNKKVQEISAQLDKFPFHNKELATKYFEQQFYLIQNTTRYLALCASKIDVNSVEEFNEWSTHLKEETNHDVLLKNDLKNLGSSLNSEILPETKALIKNTYYDIEKNSPYALLGYALILEGLSLFQCDKVYLKLKENFGISSAYLKVHSDADEKHYPEGLEKIQKLPIEVQKMVIDNLEVSSMLYSNMIKKIESQSRPLEQVA